MITRLLSALVLIIVLAVPVVFGPAWVLLFLAMIVVPWCVYELMHATLSKSASALGYILMAATEGFFWYSYQANFVLLWLFGAGTALCIIIAGLYLFEKEMATGRDVAIALSCIIYPIGLFSFWILVRNAPDGRFWMIFGLICTFIADAGAYFAGKYLGKHKVSPRLSPKKTVEGLIGGIAASVILGLVLGLGYDKIANVLSMMEPFVRSYPVWLFVVLGFVIALLDLAGDLTASMFKREFGIKDFGNIIPGHGGMLDRMDGVIPVGAALYLILSFIT
jgi:phosphatidate cytidylyltransferase